VSQENVEIVREVFITRSGGDQEAGLHAIDPMAELDMSGVTGWAEKQVYRGADEVRPFLQAWANAWRGWHYDVDDVCDAGEKQVFVAIHEWATGVESGVSVDQRRYFAIDLDNGLIVRIRMFSDREPALKAVGLEE
jgi:ketosteroid isomerase-like protein